MRSCRRCVSPQHLHVHGFTVWKLNFFTWAFPIQQNWGVSRGASQSVIRRWLRHVRVVLASHANAWYSTAVHGIETLHDYAHRQPHPSLHPVVYGRHVSPALARYWGLARWPITLSAMGAVPVIEAIPSDLAGFVLVLGWCTKSSRQSVVLLPLAFLLALRRSSKPTCTQSWPASVASSTTSPHYMTPKLQGSTEPPPPAHPLCGRVVKNRRYLCLLWRAIYLLRALLPAATAGYGGQHDVTRRCFARSLAVCKPRCHKHRCRNALPLWHGATQSPWSALFPGTEHRGLALRRGFSCCLGVVMPRRFRCGGAPPRNVHQRTRLPVFPEAAKQRRRGLRRACAAKLGHT